MTNLEMKSTPWRVITTQQSIRIENAIGLVLLERKLDRDVEADDVQFFTMIAAAPALYKALKDLLEDPCLWVSAHDNRFTRERVANAEATLAIAEGRKVMTESTLQDIVNWQLS